ncbi:MAG: formate dehydrogenase subunit delta [Burkholderiaceae bacterium]|nr:formate dehydrogenase subunit delta [Burkholderiaceae bacterium]MCF8183647.1 formate dehydrogenase subunit delta [Polynucleobacter sp.]
MNLDKLIKMANQIGDFFEAMPDRQQAVIDVAGHLQRTWEPRMREQLCAAMDGSAAARLKPLVRDALISLNKPAAPVGKSTSGG